MHAEGSWFISKRSVTWFAETWHFSKIQAQWHCSTKEAQRCMSICVQTKQRVHFRPQELMPHNLAFTRRAVAPRAETSIATALQKGLENACRLLRAKVGVS